MRTSPRRLFVTHSGHDASYSITSSASMIKLRGMVRPDFMPQVVTELIRPGVRVEVEIITAAKRGGHS